MDAAEEFLNRKIPAKIFALVHDSIVVTVHNDYIDIAKSILKECVQKDRGCSIPGYPIVIEQEVGKEYSFGKFDEVYKFDGTSVSRISDRK
jgi:DNA polymerase I-like protein with 3'-5' exonuclease and polymerase domains